MGLQRVRYWLSMNAHMFVEKEDKKEEKIAEPVCFFTPRSQHLRCYVKGLLSGLRVALAWALCRLKGLQSTHLGSGPRPGTDRGGPQWPSSLTDLGMSSPDIFIFPFSQLLCSHPEDPLEEGMATRSSILVRSGQRSLKGYSSWGCRQSDTTEQLTPFFQGIKTKSMDIEDFEETYSQI